MTFPYKHHFAIRPELQALLSRLLIIGIVVLVFIWFDRFDWRQPFTKLICHSILAFTLIIAVKISLNVSKSSKVNSKVVAWIDITLGILMIAAAFYKYSLPSAYISPRPGISDMATSTYDAARRFFLHFDNPYVGQRKSPFQPDFAYWYGPVTFLGYFISVVSPVCGMKLANVFLLIVCAALLGFLAQSDDKQSRLEKIGSVFFSVGLLCVPFRLWHELYLRATNDLLEPILFFSFLLALHRKYWILAGVFAGLASGSKIIFGLIAVVCMLRRLTPLKFYYGYAIGMIPVYFFVFLNPQAFFNGFLKFQLVRGFDNTSLYAITPPELHWIFNSVRIAFIIYILIVCFNRKHDIRETGYYAYLLLIVLEVTGIEMHGNHFIWLIPMTALVMTWNRNFLMRTNLNPQPPVAE